MAEIAPEVKDRGLFGFFGKKEEEGEKHEEKIAQPSASNDEAQTEAAAYYPAAPHPGVEQHHGHGHEGQLSPEEAEQQKHAGLGLFGKKDEKEKHEEKTHTDNEAQIEAASYYPAAPQHGVEHAQGHGHEGQFTPEEAEQQKHGGLLEKLHSTHSSSSSSSSDEEEEEKKKEKEKKKKDAKDKTKKKLSGDEQHSSDQFGVEEEKKHSSDQYGVEEEKKAGLLDKAKEKLPGHPNKGEGEEKVEVEKKAGLLDKIKEKLPKQPNKKEGEEEEEVEVEKKAGLLDKIKEKLPGHRKKEGEEEEKKQHY